jgi:hypothetical protein
MIVDLPLGTDERPRELARATDAVPAGEARPQPIDGGRQRFRRHGAGAPAIRAGSSRSRQRPIGRCTSAALNPRVAAGA